MKIVCDACSAKYSIADEKVKGKVFKIRCKKCSNIIVVRGAAGAAAEEPAPAQYDQKETRVYDYQGYDDGAGAAPAADDQVWHVVIDQEQVGPMTMAEVQQRFAAGQIDADTYVWREGFADWQPLSSVDVFASMVSEGGPTAVAGSGAAAVANMFGTPAIDDQATTRADSGDLFAAASARSRAAEHEDDGAGDLFGAPPAAGAAPAAQQPAAQSRLRGERNENSVLFSLGNLAQLASNAPAASASASASPAAGGGGGGGGGGAAAAAPAGGEGSGLIDIRSMASAYLGGEKGGAKPAAGTIGSMDDLPVFSSTAFNEPAVLMPTPGRQQNNRLLYMLIGLVGVLAIVAVVMVVIVLKGGDDKPAASVAQNDDTEDKDKDKDTTDTAGTTGTTPTEGSATGAMGTTPGSGAAPPPTTTGSAAATPPTTGGTADTPKATPPPATPKSGGDRKKPRSSGGSKPDTSSSKATPPPTTSTSSSSDSGGGGCDEVSCVLNNYEGSCCAKFRKGGSKGGGGGGSTGSKPKSDLPEALDRSDVADGVSKVKARVQACGGKSSAKGEVKVSVKVSPDGNVTSASIKSSPDPALGSCVSAAMQKATFKKTQNGGSFSYPWRF